MAVPVHGNKEIRTPERLDIDPEHARPILERAFPREHAAGDDVTGRDRRKSRLMLVIGVVLLMVAAFVAGYAVRGTDSTSTTDTPAVVEQTTPRSPDAIDRPVEVAPTTPVSPDAIDRPEVVAPTTPVSPDAIDR